MIKIRASVFETNSSSTHALIISSYNGEIYDTIEPDEDGMIVLNGFVSDKHSAIAKANYILEYAKSEEEYMKMFLEVIHKNTKAKGIIIDQKTTQYSEAWDAFPSAFIDKASLEDFLFNPNSYIRIRDRDAEFRGEYDD